MLTTYWIALQKSAEDIRKHQWVLAIAITSWLAYWLLRILVFRTPFGQVLTPYAPSLGFGLGRAAIGVMQPFLYGLALVLATSVALGDRPKLLDIAWRTITITLSVLVVSWVAPFLISIIRVGLDLPVPEVIETLTILLWHPLPEIIAIEGGLVRSVRPWLTYVKKSYLVVTLPSVMLWFLAVNMYEHWAVRGDVWQIPGMILLPVLVYVGTVFRANLYVSSRSKTQTTTHCL